MRVRKAVITAAGDRHASLPLQSVVDRSGEVRTALRLTLDEIVQSGVEDIAIVIRPGQQDSYLLAAGPHASRLIFFEQHNPRGYGDAILRTADFVQQQPFLHLVSDHLYLSRTDQPCARQLLDVAARHECSVSAIQPTRENEIVHFGTVGGSPVAREQGL
ncbi:MAG: UTP--glucose-1-phosphate uridylyltransferase, partial [Planctomycetaceae bacterium]